MVPADAVGMGCCGRWKPLREVFLS